MISAGRCMCLMWTKVAGGHPAPAPRRRRALLPGPAWQGASSRGADDCVIADATARSRWPGSPAARRDRLRRDHDRRVHRMRAVRPREDRPDRAAHRHLLRRPPALRARDRFPAAARGAGRRHRAWCIELCGGAASEIDRSGRPPGLEPRRRSCASSGSTASAGRTSPPPRPWPRWTASASRAGGGRALRHRRGAKLAQRRGAAAIAGPGPDLPHAKAAAEGAAAIEPEVDLIEEVLRLKGLDAIAPVSLPVASRHPRPDPDRRNRPARRWRGAAWRRGGCWRRHLQLRR